MAGWKSTLSKILDGLVDQGARTRPGPAGATVVFLPDGASMMTFHISPSDRRTMANYRATVRRAGLDWPLDRA